MTWQLFVKRYSSSVYPFFSSCHWSYICMYWELFRWLAYKEDKAWSAQGTDLDIFYLCNITYIDPCNDVPLLWTTCYSELGSKTYQVKSTNHFRAGMLWEWIVLSVFRNIQLSMCELLISKSFFLKKKLHDRDSRCPPDMTHSVVSSGDSLFDQV